MKALVVYYSRTGTTRRVAESLSSELICDLEPINDAEDRSGIIGYMRSAWEAMRKKTPAIHEPGHDPSEFDLVVIGTAVWVQAPASPVRTYLKRYSEMIDNIAYFCTYGGKGAKSAFGKMTEMGGHPSATLALKARVVKKRAYMDKVKTFVEKLESPSS